MSTTAPPASDDQLDVTAVLARAAERLASRFTCVFSTETVERYVFESYAALHRTARVKQHLPTLTNHFATERLTALAQTNGLLPKPVPEAPFVCVQNAERSQLATALLAHHGHGRVHVRSAGFQPAAELENQLVTVLDELGLNLEAAFPKPLTDDVVSAADAVITMGCGDACPVFPGKRHRDWDVPDPDGRTIQDSGSPRHPRHRRRARDRPARRDHHRSRRHLIRRGLRARSAPLGRRL
ncbi:three-helix bundle dimerization domain-containing protein [Streptomyces sp. NPDC091219]|uniref:arsenate reductase/protein-tyrosine-phosphatase family protein n=1 Tax=Streptomyces sp. NPDC091219 TaxID=3155193 RepID=UPI00344EEA2B